MYLRIVFLLAATLVVTAQHKRASLDTVGSNWYISSTTSESSVSGDYPSLRYNVIQNGHGSSFVPTSKNNHPSGASEVSNGQETNNRAFFYPLTQSQQYPSGEKSVGKQHQYLQYYPEGNSFNIYPVPGSNQAEQRQEFLDPNISGLGPIGDDGDGSIFDNLPSLGGLTSGVSGTASNIAQSIGLGSLGVLGSILVVAVGAPLIVFAILFPAAIIIIAVLGFPVLQLTLPPNDFNLGRKLKSGVMSTARKAREVLQSEECVERFSCVIARKSRTLPYESWILERMEKVTNSLAHRISKSVKSGRAGEDCKRFTCTPVTKIKSMYDAFLLPQSNK